jgi:hypothetical protein
VGWLEKLVVNEYVEKSGIVNSLILVHYIETVAEE